MVCPKALCVWKEGERIHCVAFHSAHDCFPKLTYQSFLVPWVSPSMFRGVPLHVLCGGGERNAVDEYDEFFALAMPILLCFAAYWLLR